MIFSRSITVAGADTVSLAAIVVSDYHITCTNLDYSGPIDIGVGTVTCIDTVVSIGLGTTLIGSRIDTDSDS